MFSQLNSKLTLFSSRSSACIHIGLLSPKTASSFVKQTIFISSSTFLSQLIVLLLHYWTQLILTKTYHLLFQIPFHELLLRHPYKGFLPAYIFLVWDMLMPIKNSWDFNSIPGTRHFKKKKISPFHKINSSSIKEIKQWTKILNRLKIQNFLQYYSVVHVLFK